MQAMGEQAKSIVKKLKNFGRDQASSLFLPALLAHYRAGHD